MEIFWYAFCFLGYVWGFLGYFFMLFLGASVKLGVFCRAWMPGLDVNSVQVGEADQSSPTTVLRSKEERQNISI